MALNNLSIVVSSWDRYAACWPPFCHGLTKYWPNCPFPVYFITNYADAPCGLPIKIGEERGWSSNMLLALRRIETPYVLFMQEDYWLEAAVDNGLILDYLALIEQGKVDYVCIGKCTRHGDLFPDDPRCFYFPDDAEWRPSLFPSLWRKAIFESLIVEGETIWEFERNGVQRTEANRERFVLVGDPALKYARRTALVRGLWVPEAFAYAKREGIKVDFSPIRPMGRLMHLYVTLVPNLDHRHAVNQRLKAALRLIYGRMPPALQTRIPASISALAQPDKPSSA